MSHNHHHHHLARRNPPRIPANGRFWRVFGVAAFLAALVFFVIDVALWSFPLL